ncbi:MAG: hypothetical protein DSM106950_30415 [Stigonema ocellatum SAG 48.90 = DSM 106950]|nr:hypothetical protein [Stigonema ocellatum SAG 48.90 = DSM 106950]
MIRRSLLTAALILVGSAVVGESAFAQSVDINFTGTVQGRCSFNTPTGGTLAADGGSGPVSTYMISSLAPGGAPGQVTVTCNQPANLLVSNPIQTGGPSGGMSGARVDSPAGQTSSGSSIGSLSGGSSGPLFLPPGATPLAVQMGVQSGPNGPLQPGNYNYKVTLTITP